jgi:hypothetical protein
MNIGKMKKPVREVAIAICTLFWKVYKATAKYNRLIIEKNPAAATAIL